MIQIFRRIRQSLLKENKIGKYLAYAFGEILLVIVGILIALFINNWNENRKTENKIEQIFKGIQSDLYSDIKEADKFLNFIDRKDSLMNLVLSDSLNEEDYRNNIQLTVLIGTFDEFKINTSSYNHLESNLDNIPEKYIEIYRDLNEIYVSDRKTIDLMNRNYGNYVTSILEKWADRYSWYSDVLQLKPNQEAYDYFLDNPIYKNEVINYSIYGKSNLMNRVKKFKHDAIIIYKEIANQVFENDDLPSEIADYESNKVEINNFEPFVGTYKFTYQTISQNIEVSHDSKALIMKMQGQPELKFYTLSEKKFKNPITNIEIEFIKNEAGIYQAMDYKQGDLELVLERIKN